MAWLSRSARAAARRGAGRIHAAELAAELLKALTKLAGRWVGFREERIADWAYLTGLLSLVPCEKVDTLEPIGTALGCALILTFAIMLAIKQSSLITEVTQCVPELLPANEH